MKIQARILHPGSVSGPILRLDDPLSFWGGFDPEQGKIIDQHHPQAGQLMKGRILVLPSTRGSSGTPGVLGESLRLGTGPDAIILGKPDVNVVAAATVVDALYQKNVPVLVVEGDDYAKLSTEASVYITEEGIICLG